MERELAAANQERNGITPADDNNVKGESGTLENGNGDDESTKTHSDSGSDETDFEEDDGFDYLAYAQDRALFFWADVLSLGLIDEKELPSAMLEAIKPRVIKY